MNKKIDIMATVKDGIAIALVNFVSLILTTVLYVLTLWIPYLNVGTTIAMCSLPAEMAKGGAINPLFIFKGEYRKNMGEFFILMSFMMGAISVGFMFMFIPGIVISIAFGFASVLFVDKNMSALEALRESNKITYGNKWRIFGAEFVLCFALGIATAIINAIFGIGEIGWLEAIGNIIVVLLILFVVPAIYGVEASIYKQLTAENNEAPAAPAPAPAPEAPKAPKAE